MWQTGKISIRPLKGCQAVQTLSKLEKRSGQGVADTTSLAPACLELLEAAVMRYGIAIGTITREPIVIAIGFIVIVRLVVAFVVADYADGMGFPFAPIFISPLFLGFPLPLLLVALTPPRSPGKQWDGRGRDPGPQHGKRWDVPGSARPAPPNRGDWIADAAGAARNPWPV